MEMYYLDPTKEIDMDGPTGDVVVPAGDQPGAFTPAQEDQLHYAKALIELQDQRRPQD